MATSIEPKSGGSCEFLVPAGAGPQLFRAAGAGFVSEGAGNRAVQLGILLAGQVRTQTPAGLLVSDAREAPQIWLLPANMPFAVTGVPGFAPAILGASIEASALEEVVRESGVRGLRADVPRVLRDPVAALGLEAFHRSLWSGAPRLEWESWLFTSLGRLFRGDAREGGRAREEPAHVAVARDYLHAHYQHAVSLDELSRVSGASKFHLVRAFRAAVGVPPHTYQLRLRLTRSLFLLRGGLAPSAVAAELGFADQSHFTRAFRAEFGTTPAVWLRGTARPGGGHSAAHLG